MATDPLFDRLARALAGRYTLLRELGRGGMATVYLGTDVKLERRVAIKLLAPATRAYLGSDRFQREVLLAAQLSHPHIVPLFEADEADGLLFYVMEYVEGESLRQRLSRHGPLPVDDAVRIAAEVGDALQYAHENGVIHRDVKPENILLSHGHALVSDFGIAKLIEEGSGTGGTALTGAGIAVGTAAYMSPEQASGDKGIDPRSDVYSLAVVLYEMLAGEPPFTGPSAQAISARVINDSPRPIRTVRPGLPAHLERALARGLAKQPGDRPHTARAFVAGLVAPARQRRRLSAGQVTWIASACGAAAILGWVVWPTSRVPPPPGMALVPAGFYPVGGGPGHDSTSVRLDAFFIDSAEVSIAAFQRYLDSTRAAPPWTKRPPDQLPVTGVRWGEAAGYCAWRGLGGRLPSEDEWEAAARGPRGLLYPWGNRWERGRANADSVRDRLTAAGAGSRGRSWMGAVDMIGNAWEWTATAGVGPGGLPGHVIKGGAFDTPQQHATTTFRAAFPNRGSRPEHTGFRCARSVAVAPERAAAPASVAVLYFETPDTASAYLADGLTEAIITSLGRVERLSVKSRNAVRRFRGAAEDPATLGRTLGVAYLVSGNVPRPGRGQRPGVTVELLRASDGMHVWGGQYPTRDTALQTIPEAVARAVATVITGALRPVERTALANRPPRDPEAYDHFLRANYELAQRSPRAVRRAIDQFAMAVRLDPGFTPALARIAVGYGLFLDWGWEYPGLSPEAVLAGGFDAADRALRQDSASADAWMARGFLLSFRNPRTFAGVREALLRALELDPRNAEAHHQYGMALLWLGRDSAAADMYRRALALEPERPITLFNLGRVAARQTRYAEARRWADSALTIDPGADYGYVLRALSEFRLGNRAEARADAETAARLRAGFRVPGEAVLALVELQAADTLAARTRIVRMEREIRSAGHPTITDAAWVGRALVALGESARALELLERVRPRGARLWYYLRAPEFDAIRSSPRFGKLVAESQPE
jgi:formylglycine-generating enzyme required for sulfatase activity/TolB-like protein/cytochrome c-type biogenesis protein CcmH/NrfG